MVVYRNYQMVGCGEGVLYMALYRVSCIVGGSVLGRTPNIAQCASLVINVTDSGKHSGQREGTWEYG